MDGSGLGIVLANHNSGGTWKRGNRSLRLCVGLIEPPLINLAHFGVPGYLKVSPSMRSAPQRRKCLIDEGGKSLPEGLVAARQQSRREHVGTIRTMLAHVPVKTLFDKGYRYRRRSAETVAQSAVRQVASSTPLFLRAAARRSAACLRHAVKNGDLTFEIDVRRFLGRRSCSHKGLCGEWM